MLFRLLFILAALLAIAGQSQAQQCQLSYINGQWVRTCPQPSFNYSAPAQIQIAQPVAPKDLPWWAARVGVDLGNGRGQGGSGTPIHTEGGRTLILTNAHVVPRNLSGNPLSVDLKGKRYPAKYVDGSEVSNIGPSLIDIQGPDLCILSIDAEVDSVKIATGIPAVGSEVWQWGYGGTQPDQHPIPRGGPVCPPQFVGEAFQVGYQPISGDSGAGVFDANGELCAVCTGSSGAQGRVVSVVTVRSFVVRPIVHRLFPRLADRLAVKRLTAPAATPATPAPTVPPKAPAAPPVAPPAAVAPKK